MFSFLFFFLSLSFPFHRKFFSFFGFYLLLCVLFPLTVKRYPQIYKELHVDHIASFWKMLWLYLSTKTVDDQRQGYKKEEEQKRRTVSDLSLLLKERTKFDETANSFNWEYFSLREPKIPRDDPLLAKKFVEDNDDSEKIWGTFIRLCLSLLSALFCHNKDASTSIFLVLFPYSQTVTAIILPHCIES